MATPKRMVSGQAFIGPSATDHNAFVDNVETVRRLSTLDRPRRTGVSAQLKVLVNNTTGALINVEFPVLEIDGPNSTPADRFQVVHELITLKGKTPTATAKMSDIVIVQSRIPPGGENCRPAVLMGPTWCLVNVTNAAHTHVVPTTGDNTKLTSASSGTTKIHWKESGTGTKKALIILGGGGESGGKLRVGKTKAAGISARTGTTLGVGTVDRYGTASRPALTNLTIVDTVYNIAGTAVAGNAWIAYGEDEQGTLIVLVEDCTPPPPPPP